MYIYIHTYRFCVSSLSLELSVAKLPPLSVATESERVPPSYDGIGTLPQLLEFIMIFSFILNIILVIQLITVGYDLAKDNKSNMLTNCIGTLSTIIGLMVCDHWLS